jgi:hypothetical protein
MQAELERKRQKAQPAQSGRIVSSYTCPRCRQYAKTSRCPRCGWSPDSVATPEAGAGHEDRIVAC